MPMKKNILLIASSLILGIIITFFVLNKENIYAKEKYKVYAFEVGSYNTYENALNNNLNIPYIIVNHDNLYKLYIAIFEDLDITNDMLLYFKQNNINPYLKMIEVDKDFYNKLLQYEELIKKLEDTKAYDQINQSILKEYGEVSNENS